MINIFFPTQNFSSTERYQILCSNVISLRKLSVPIVHSKWNVHMLCIIKRISEIFCIEAWYQNRSKTLEIKLKMQNSSLINQLKEVDEICVEISLAEFEFYKLFTIILEGNLYYNIIHFISSNLWINMPASKYLVF